MLLVRQCLAALLVLPLVGSVIQFGPQKVIAAPAGVLANLVAVDLNGDTYLDVLPVRAPLGEVPRDLAWYENRQGGIFSAPRVVAASDHGQLLAADLNKDGHIDVLACIGPDSSVAWYPGEGQGVFGATQIISETPGTCTSLSAGDLDGDGGLDIVVATSAPGRIVWYKNLGDGGFGSEQEVETASDTALNVTQLLSASRTDDQAVDVIAVWRSLTQGNIVLYSKNSPDGNWIAHSVFSSTEPASVQAAHLADLDHDGRLDVVFVGGDDLQWCRNLGEGSFAGAAVIASALGNEGGEVATGAISASDLNMDGDTDILVTAGGAIYWYENDARGQFVGQEVARGSLPRAADLNSDGLPDLLAVAVDGSIVWFENLGRAMTHQSTTTDVGVNSGQGHSADDPSGNATHGFTASGAKGCLPERSCGLAALLAALAIG